MSSLNQVNIIGRLGRDPETRYLASGEAVTNFSVATSEIWKDKATGEKREATEWHRASTFGRLAEVAGQYLQKGSLVFIQGKLVTRKYQDKDGIERTSTEVKVNELRMLSSKNEQQGGGEAAPQRQQRPSAQQQKPASGGSGFDDMDDDIPF